MGYFLVTLGAIFVGPSKLFHLYNSTSFILLGLAIVGSGASMITIPIMPEIIDAVEDRYVDVFDEEDLHN